MKQHVVVTLEDRLAAWRAADQAATAAELRVRGLGPGTSDVGIRDHAAMLRQQADTLFAALLREVEMDRPTV